MKVLQLVGYSGTMEVEMKRIINSIWDKGNKYFTINNYRNEWKENGNKPMLKFFTNGSKKKNKKDTCLDVTLIIGYTIINYTNFSY